jgi:hypothetical protein
MILLLIAHSKIGCTIYGEDDVHLEKNDLCLYNRRINLSILELNI